MLRVALVRDFDEESLFGVRLYADRIREALVGKCEVVEVRPRPRRAVAFARPLQTLAVKEVLYPLAVRGVRGDVAHVVDQSHAHLATWIRGCPTVVTCHDLWGLKFGGRLRRWGYNRRLRGLRAASRVVTVSENTRREVVALGVDAERVVTVRNRVDRFFLDAPNAAEVAAARQRCGDEPSVLHVGNTLPYKNVEALVRALAEVRRTTRRNVPLVKAGAELTSSQQELARREGVPVRHLGEVSRAELRALYHAADCLAYPSLDEGFGWPVAEALACGQPVIAGRSGALPEVAGDAALFVDPENVADLAAAIVRVLGDPALRRDLGARGLVRGQWLADGDFGGELAAVYRQVAGKVAGQSAG